MVTLTSEQIDDEFLRLCTLYRPSIIGDIGTRDCADAVRIKQSSPTSAVIAFEANPENYFDYCLSDDILKCGIAPNHLAISDSIGTAKIMVPHYASKSEGGTIQQRGMSSLLGKVNTTHFVEYTVPKTTVDAFFSYEIESDHGKTFSFWVDVEGLAFEVLTGMKKILQKTLFLKIEVEAVEYYSGQRLAKDVIDLMADGPLDYYKSTDPAPGQFDIIFVNRSLRDH